MNCVICQNAFCSTIEKKQTTPIVCICCHTFCVDCIKNIKTSSTSSKVKCPLCAKTLHPLGYNFALIDCIEERRSDKEETTITTTTSSTTIIKSSVDDIYDNETDEGVIMPSSVRRQHASWNHFDYMNKLVKINDLHIVGETIGILKEITIIQDGPFDVYMARVKMINTNTSRHGFILCAEHNCHLITPESDKSLFDLQQLSLFNLDNGNNNDIWQFHSCVIHDEEGLLITCRRIDDDVYYYCEASKLELHEEAQQASTSSGRRATKRKRPDYLSFSATDEDLNADENDPGVYVCTALAALIKNLQMETSNGILLNYSDTFLDLIDQYLRCPEYRTRTLNIMITQSKQFTKALQRHKIRKSGVLGLIFEQFQVLIKMNEKTPTRPTVSI